MQQHPVPQQIASYEFKLVGDMTLKQFLQLAGGLILALLVWASGLPAILKWPLALLFGFSGVAMAFIPIEERSFSSWVASFFKSVYSPTHYEWVAGASEDVFAKGQQEPTIVAPEGAEKARKYLSSIPVPKVLTVFEEAEENFMSYVQNLFHQTPLRQDFAGQAQAPPTPHISIPRVEEIPVTQPIKVEPQPQTVQQTVQAPAYTPQKISPVLGGQPRASGQSQDATFSLAASPPSPPEQPNTIVGQILGPDGKLVEAAILEVKDASGQSVRALKSNKVGHFMTATPLPDGEYEIEIEKEGMVFDRVKFTASGGIIPPIEIRAKQSRRAGEQEN